MIQVTVNIDEKMFDDSIGATLKEMKPEEIQDMISNCIREYLLGKNSEGNNNIETLLYDVEKTYYGGSNLKPSYFTRSMLEKLDYSGLQDVVDKCVNDLKENHREIIEKILLEMMVEGLTRTYCFDNVIERTVKDIIINRESNDNNRR